MFGRLVVIGRIHHRSPVPTISLGYPSYAAPTLAFRTEAWKKKTMAAMNMRQTVTYLIVGLGNPGKEHHLNRHNVGFMFLDQLAAELGFEFSRHQFSALVTDGPFEGNKIILAKPQTFMNLVGRSVGPLTRYYRISTSDLIVAYDDLDLPSGTIRLRPAGGSAGHKGMQSIFENLGTKAFTRLRIGIGRPPGEMDPADYVLQNFSQVELQMLEVSLIGAVDCIRLFIREGIQAAMTYCNSPSE
ncbi:MAG: aminoacyl-tRNA hydrolase [Anaerolineales bacterium]|nr:MAG: aminoacyl-tRNA hydrolase [Anaerolineales bacterium]